MFILSSLLLKKMGSTDFIRKGSMMVCIHWLIGEKINESLPTGTEDDQEGRLIIFFQSCMQQM